MWERIRLDAAEVYAEGGPVLAVILAVSLLGWALLFRLLVTHALAPAPAPAPSAALLERVRFEDALARDRTALRFVALLASASPLLGLLGTVLGMMDTFAFLGRQDLPRIDALAGGVSRALVTTQAGLLAALTLVAGHTTIDRLLRRRLRRAGMLG